LAEHRPVVGIGGAAQGMAGGDVVQADRDRVVRPQAQLDAVGRGGQEQAPAQILAGEIEEQVGILQDRRLDEVIARLDEEGRQAVGGRGDHDASYCRSRRSQIAVTRSASATSNWPGRSSRQTALSAIAADSILPRARSLICTTPRLRSSSPWMTTAGLLRRSAYFIWAFIPDSPR